MGLSGMCQLHRRLPIAVFLPHRREVRGFEGAPRGGGELNHGWTRMGTDYRREGDGKG
jgi:hypothetical protein